MNEPTAGTVADKVADKVAGALERLVDARMLILGISFLLYLDIWLINANLDPHQITIDGALGKMKLLSIGDVAVFVVSYSLLMSATIPAIRMVYIAFMSSFVPSSSGSAEQSVEGRQLSRWALGVVVFAVWDGAVGYFQFGKYRGAVAFLVDRLAGDGIAVDIFRVSASLFFLFCLLLAFERDG
ncbi:hypothetical protein [Burkholderia pseudomallei]|uniref:hypothetical protein n=1 Tax=Burkholderia pseudomallei TaxID=28450 RepID=UPI000E5ABFF5|nr:hypothetical protein [Burkholderia pseudomallei]QGT05890.1 hypothetical protein D286_17185 [Burkholderia pseudomallei]